MSKYRRIDFFPPSIVSDGTAWTSSGQFFNHHVGRMSKNGQTCLLHKMHSNVTIFWWLIYDKVINWKIHHWSIVTCICEGELTIDSLIDRIKDFFCVGPRKSCRTAPCCTCSFGFIWSGLVCFSAYMQVDHKICDIYDFYSAFQNYLIIWFAQYQLE